jgi:hypothetical protein
MGNLNGGAMLITDITVNNLVKILENKGFIIKRKGAYALNLVGIRTEDPTPNLFNDFFCIFYKTETDVHFHVFPCTTDPGLYYLKEPVNIDGTAILKTGQYIDTFQLGKHRKKYKALVQSKPVLVYRDNNRDENFDLTDTSIQEGLFGINIHKASLWRESKQGDKWSAGCQVLSNPFDFNILIAVVEKSLDVWKQNAFTYTLIEEKDFLAV